MYRKLNGLNEKNYYLDFISGYVYEIELSGKLNMVYSGEIRIKRKKKDGTIVMVSYLVDGKHYQLPFDEAELMYTSNGLSRFYVTDESEAKRIQKLWIASMMKDLEKHLELLKYYAEKN